MTEYTDEEEAEDIEKENVFDALLKALAGETERGEQMIAEWSDKPHTEGVDTPLDGV